MNYGLCFTTWLLRKTRYCRILQKCRAMSASGDDLAWQNIDDIWEFYRIWEKQRKIKRQRERERKRERERRIPIKISNSKFAINSTTWRMNADAFDVPRGTCLVLKTCRYSRKASHCNGIRWTFGFTVVVEYVRSLSAIPPLRFPVSWLASIPPWTSHKSPAISAVFGDTTILDDPVKERIPYAVSIIDYFTWFNLLFIFFYF